MFCDDKGYLVKEMVWEEVTDDESDHPVQPPSSSIAKNNSSTDKKSVPAPKPKPAPAAGPQKSISSFFSKK